MIELSPEEIRVLGCLLEKEVTTPQSYPLTLNALRSACNQSTSRDPVTDLSEATIELALQRLRAEGLVRVVHSPSNRAAKYRHVLNDAWNLHGAELAVLAVLMLRGPQTPGELKARTERQHRFVEMAELEDTLASLAGHEPEPLVVSLERSPGQKEQRYAALLGGARSAIGDRPTSPDAVGEVRARSEGSGDRDLAAEVDDLHRQLAELRAEFDTFRRAFE